MTPLNISPTNRKQRAKTQLIKLHPSINITQWQSIEEMKEGDDSLSNKNVSLMANENSPLKFKCLLKS